MPAEQVDSRAAADPGADAGVDADDPPGDAPGADTAAARDARPEAGDALVPSAPLEAARARRLLRLRVLLKSMLGIAAVAVAFVLFSAFLSDDGEEDTLPALRVAIGDMLPGETRTLTWDGRPVLVHRRTPAAIRALEASEGEGGGTGEGAPDAAAGGALRARLRDPDSARSEQPPGMGGALRSAEPEWFVAIGLGTDYGCPLAWLAPEPAPFAGAAWPGGFVDGCRGSRYDAAGRVYADQYADRNLAVPPHTIDGGTLVLGGRRAQ